MKEAHNGFRRKTHQSVPQIAVEDNLVAASFLVLLPTLLPLSLYFLLVQLDVRKLWVRLLCCLLMFSP